MKRKTKKRIKRNKEERAFLLSAMQAVLALSVSVMFFISAVIFDNCRLKDELFRLVRENPWEEEEILNFRGEAEGLSGGEISKSAVFSFFGREPVPVRGNITSPFGKRINPILGKKEFHKGIDLKASEGTRVRAAFPGKCVQTGFNKFDGNFVVLEHGNFFTKYCHLKEISVFEGKELQKGQTVGQVGHTGLATGSHLHFEIIKDGRYIDPVCAFEGEEYEI